MRDRRTGISKIMSGKRVIKSMPGHTVRILLLEDDLETVTVLTHRLYMLEHELEAKGMDLSLVVLSEYSMVEQYINPDTEHTYDIVLLDRDCKAGGSFHALNLDKFDLDRVVSISSTPEWNKLAESRGIKRVVHKTFDDLNGFAENVLAHIRELLSLPTPDEDPMLTEAIKLARTEGKISPGLMQDRLKISYARAARLLDLMEEQGVIGPTAGNKPREVLL
jgi:DNA segregation ATPase FtsK/SpoIIIE-like protein